MSAIRPAILAGWKPVDGRRADSSLTTFRTGGVPYSFGGGEYVVQRQVIGHASARRRGRPGRA